MFANAKNRRTVGIMEQDPNIMPEIKILKCPPPIEGIARAIGKALAFIPDLGITHGDHFQKTGAAEMLDEHLSEQ